jgi:DNA-binding response OmpR family regulator
MVEGKKILIAEDEPDIRALIVYGLRFAGYTVIEALDGREAIKLAEREQPDLILLDVRMPKMDGYEACAILRAQESTREIPVAFLSARGQEVEIKHGLELGAEEYILKPFGPDELNERVASILERLGRE